MSSASLGAIGGKNWTEERFAAGGFFADFRSRIELVPAAFLLDWRIGLRPQGWKAMYI